MAGGWRLGIAAPCSDVCCPQLGGKIGGSKQANGPLDNFDRTRSDAPREKGAVLYIKRVVLEDLRGFKKLDFEFERSNSIFAGWTVVTGDNAAGKTALIKAISLALVGPDAARALQTSLRGWVRNGAKEAVAAVQIVPGKGDKPVTGHPYEQPFWSELSLKKNGGPDVSLQRVQKFGPAGKKGPIHGPWAENPSGWFAAGYGPFRRLYGASSDAQRLMSGPPKLARFATLFREDATLGESEQWLKDLHHKSLEGKAKEQAILNQVRTLLDDDYMRRDFAVDKIDSDGLWLRGKDGTQLPLESMSEGYRAALAMLIDILRFMVETYGHEDILKKQEDGSVVVIHPGIVLIDEIDAHLHPEWQRQIGFWLKQRFPAVQFIVTTHSPLICQAADENGLFHLPPPGDPRGPFRLDEDERIKVIASKADAVLLGPAFELTHTLSPVAVAAREELAKLRAKKAARPLNQGEQVRMRQLSLFAPPDEG